MNDSELAVQLERRLAASDLCLSGTALYRKLAQGPERFRLAENAFRRIDPNTLLVNVDTDGTLDAFGQPVLVVATGGKVQALVVPLEDYAGDYGGPWRRTGDRIVGTARLIMGNTQNAAVYDFRLIRGRWRLVAHRLDEEEATDIRFLGERLDRVRITVRSYDTLRLGQPHIGPLLVREIDWRLGPERIAATDRRFLPTPFLALDRFVDALAQGDGKTAASLCRPSLFARAKRLFRENWQQGAFYAVRAGEGPRDRQRRLWFGRLLVEFERFRGEWRIRRVRVVEDP